MDQFEYVMVLVSIIIGLGIAHVLLGMAGIVDRVAGGTRPLRLSLAYFSWLGVVFVWTLLFWWWEYRFTEFVADWTVGLYFFLVTYAVVLFLMSAVLVPRSWDPVDDLAGYFLERRVWFYSLVLVANGLDVLDSFLKGGSENLLTTPPITLLIWSTILGACIVGLRSKAIRTHRILGVIVLILQVLSGFSALPSLSNLQA